jgi:hypothetical protein
LTSYVDARRALCVVAHASLHASLACVLVFDCSACCRCCQQVTPAHLRLHADTLATAAAAALRFWNAEQR